MRNSDMDSNKNQANFLPKDNNGCIINDTAKSKIFADFLPLISEIKNIIIDTLSNSLHSIYLTGSVPRGVAEIKKSDLDVFAILRPSASGENAALKAINESIKKVFRTTDIVSKVDIELWRFEEVFPDANSINEIRVKNTLSTFDIILKNSSLCIYGDDLSAHIPAIKPDASLANDELIMIHLDIAQARQEISAAASEEEVKYWCKRIMKNIIRAGFCLCMPIIQEQTREIKLCAEVFSKHYPDLKEFVKKTMCWIKSPSDNKQEILKFLNDDVDLFLSKVDRWMDKYNPGRLHEMPRHSLTKQLGNDYDR